MAGAAQRQRRLPSLRRWRRICLRRLRLRLLFGRRCVRAGGRGGRGSRRDGFRLSLMSRERYDARYGTALAARAARDGDSAGALALRTHSLAAGPRAWLTTAPGRRRSRRSPHRRGCRTVGLRPGVRRPRPAATATALRSCRQRRDEDPEQSRRPDRPAATADRLAFDRPGGESGPRQLSYAEFAASIRAAVSALSCQGLQRGERALPSVGQPQRIPGGLPARCRRASVPVPVNHRFPARTQRLQDPRRRRVSLLRR